MTRTEERLRDALHTSASRVSDDDLRSLAVPSARRSGKSRRTGWLAPLAAAASVALVAGTVLAVTGLLRHNDASPLPATPSGPPRFYATLQGDNRTDLMDVAVRATATGRVVSVIPGPVSPLPAGTGTAAPPSSTATPNPYARNMQSVSIATADGSTFYVLYQIQTEAGNGDFVIERFTISAAGEAGAPTLVRGGALTGLGVINGTDGFAVAPEGSKVAVSVQTPGPGNALDEILVVDTRTGTHTVWRGGLDRAHAFSSLQSLSWTADGRWLAFVAQSCSPPHPTELLGSFVECAAVAGKINRVAEVRELDTSAPGGTLSGTRVLLAQSPRYPFVSQALISPDGTVLTVMLLSGPVSQDPILGAFSPRTLTVARISATTGAEVAALYRGTDSLAIMSTLTADGSGRYLVIGHISPDAKNPFGWLDAGRYRPLPVTASTVTLAW